MGGNLAGYNAEDYEPAGEFTPVPEGWYTAMFTASEFKNTKRGDGQYLELTISVLDKPYEGRTVFARLNLDNPNDQAVQIAKGELSAICRAVGKMTPDDASELHNIPFKVKLGIKPYEGKKYNEVLAYKSIKSEGTAPPADVRPTNPPAPAPTAAGKPNGNGSGKKAPWAR